METSLRVPNPWKESPVYVRERVSSTMDEARRLAQAGTPEGTVITAGFQEKGRGRAPGRSWISQPWESLLATIVLDSRRIGFPRGQLPLRCAVAVCRAVEHVCEARFQVKWPNDLVHNGRKLAGILCETCGDAVLAGIGVNCTQRVFPPELPAVCSLFLVSGREIAPLVLLPVVLSELKAVLADDAWITFLRERLASRGEEVLVSHPPGGTVARGIVQDVDDEGRLVLRDARGALVTASQGEISSA